MEDEPPDAGQKPAASAPSLPAPALPASSSSLHERYNEVRTSDLPKLKVAPEFLSHLKQSHPTPLSAWGDIIDNCRDARATRLDVAVRHVGSPSQRVVSLTDDGSGMTEHVMATGIRGIGYTDKGLETGKHYGFGSTTSLPRLSDCALVLSVRAGQRTVCFLSEWLNEEHNSSTELVVPHCSWCSCDGQWQLLPTTTDDSNLGQRLNALNLIGDYTPFSEELLQSEFDAIGPHGTCIILWGSIFKEHKILPHPNPRPDLEILTSETRAIWKHQTSLRSYLELLYYCDETETPTMLMYVLGVKVEPREDVVGNGFEGGRALPYSLLEGLDAFTKSEELAEVLGQKFIDMYAALKFEEYDAFMQVISPWERQHLLLNV